MERVNQRPQSMQDYGKGEDDQESQRDKFNRLREANAEMINNPSFNIREQNLAQLVEILCDGTAGYFNREEDQPSIEREGAAGDRIVSETRTEQLEREDNERRANYAETGIRETNSERAERTAKGNLA